MRGAINDRAAGLGCSETLITIRPIIGGRSFSTAPGRKLTISWPATFIGDDPAREISACLDGKERKREEETLESEMNRSLLSFCNN